MTKLEEIKLLEKELGVELPVIFEAFKNGIWVKCGTHYVKHKNVDFIALEGIAETYYDDVWVEYYFKDYKKEWSLDRNDFKDLPTEEEYDKNQKITKIQNEIKDLKELLEQKIKELEQ